MVWIDDPIAKVYDLVIVIVVLASDPRQSKRQSCSPPNAARSGLAG